MRAILIATILLIPVYLGEIAVVAVSSPGRGQDVTWYDVGEYTANGENFDIKAYTCATPEAKEIGKWIRFEYKAKVVYCLANDKSPGGYDLTPAAFARLAPLKVGRLHGVSVRICE